MTLLFVSDWQGICTLLFAVQAWSVTDLML